MNEFWIYRVVVYYSDRVEILPNIFTSQKSAKEFAKWMKVNGKNVISCNARKVFNTNY